MKIDLLQFELLTTENKLEEIEEDGVFIDQKEQGGYKIRVVALHDFFVETWTDLETNRVVAIRSFDARDRGSASRHQIELDQLL